MTYFNETSKEYWQNVGKKDDFTIRFGKYKGKTFGDIPLKDLDNYLGWIETQNPRPVSKLWCLKIALTSYLEQNKNELEMELQA